MANLKFLPDPYDCLVHAQTSLETNCQQIQTIRQTQSQPLPSPIRCVGEPEIRGKEANHECQHEKDKYVVGEIHGRRQAKGCRNCQPHPQEDVSMMWLAAAPKHMPAYNFRVVLIGKKTTENGEGLRQQIRIQ